MKKIILILCIFFFSFHANAAEDLVNIDNLIQIVESLQKDVQKLNDRLDKVSEQSYESRKVSVEDRRAMKIIVKKLVKIQNSIAESKKKPDVLYSNEVQNSNREEGEYYRVNATSGLALRRKASRNSMKIGVLPDGEPVYAICGKTQRWCYAPDLHGYIYRQFIVKEK